MEKLNVKKIITFPENIYDTIKGLVKTEQKLIEALHIMESIINNPEEMDFHKHRIEKFLTQFQGDGLIK